MRLALIARRFDPGGGGTERDLLVTAQCLTRAGHEVTIYAAEVHATSAGFRIVKVPLPPAGVTVGLLRFAWTAPALARREGADLVLSFARTVGADVLRSGGGAHVAYLRAARRWHRLASGIAMRLRPYHLVQMVIERAGFKSASLRKAIAVSELVRSQLVDEFALEPQKTATLYNGVDLERFRPSIDRSERTRLRQLFKADTGAPIVAFVGNGFARKGLESLMLAWPSIESRPYLLVAGVDRSPIRYVRLAQRLGITERVRFLGAQAHVEQIFHAADALALPSFFEPFGNVVMEAMASGLGALTSAQSGVTELLPDAMRRFVVQNPGDPAEIASRLRALLQNVYDLGGIARDAAAAWPWDRYTRGLLELIASLA
jgi:UDP-glucose:(heptosyl)LPS alpha-1,3-glucosyltransferase